MQLNSLEHIINFTGTKISRITYLLNLQRGNVTVILLSVFYFIYHSLKVTFFNLQCAEKAIKKDD
jgi:hypothetical protein